MSVDLPRVSVDLSKCRHCGAHVTDQFRRVHGDDQDRAHRCDGCDSWRRLNRGSAAGLDVAIPEPTADGHHGNDHDVAADGGRDRGQLTVGGWIALFVVLGGLGAVIWGVILFA